MKITGTVEGKSIVNKDGWIKVEDDISHFLLTNQGKKVEITFRLVK